MKKIFLLSLIMLSTLSFGQKLYKKDLLNLEKNIYKKAINNYDLNAAKNSIYKIIELEGENSTYLDSLAFVYFNQKNFLSCVTVAEKILKKQEKLPILEIKAVCLENLNAPKEAIDTYEKIFKEKKEPYVAYKLAKLQQLIKRSAEAYITLQKGMDLKFPEKAYITFPGTKKGETQNIPFKAAYYHLTAMASYDLHNYDLAIKYFDEALKIDPKFFVAKQNKQAVELMRKKLNDSNANTPKKPAK